MKYTANSKLSQWEKSDRIMMSDFNSDNQKLDAALKSLTGEDASIRQTLAAMQAQINALTARTVPTLLKEITTTADANPIKLDATFIDWAVYAKIIVQARMYTQGYGPTAYFAWKDRDHVLGQGYVRTINDATEFYASTPSLLILSATGDRDHLLYSTSIHYGETSEERVHAIKAYQLEEICVFPSQNGETLSAGCNFKFYGLKI